MKKILLATAAILAFAGAASAADLRVPYKAAPVVAPMFNWTGCYIGGFIGGAWSAENVQAYDVLNYGGAVVGPHGWSYDLDSSFIGGGTLGCNWQPVGSPFVIGLEGELGFLNMEGTAYDPFQAAPFTIYSTVKIGDWYGMITGRLGYAFDRALVYVKGGVAFVDVEAAVYDPIPGNGLIATGSTSEATWTIGAGLEYAFDWNWSLKAEYMFIALDDNNVSGLDPLFGGTWNWNHELEGIHTAKIGLNYRFGVGKGPVVARY